MRHREFTSAGIGGIDLYAQAWLPERSPRSVLVIAHGLGEHGGRYERLAGELVATGHAVYAVDHRGHGRSPGPRANIERFAHVVSDFSAFVGRANRQHPDAALFVLGHSMGGAVAFASAQRLQSTLRGLVLSAPALAVDPLPSGLQALMLRTLSSVAPNSGAMTIAAGEVSRDPHVVAAYQSDPLVHHKAVPARTVQELVQAMLEFPRQAPALRLPTLVLHGTADRLVSLTAVRPVCQAIGARDKTIRYYDGLSHEVLNEPEREQVVHDLMQWLDR
jgi:alpha-beta hydrolase superfamily lysophospholipase